MSSGVVECKICLENFDSQDHRPLSLDCGHIFCEFCVRKRARKNHSICATCRTPTTKPVGQLLVKYDLIPSEGRSTTNPSPAPAVGKCVDHGYALEQFCAECGVTVCSRCVRSSHDGHRIDFIANILTMDPDAAATNEKLKNKIETKIGNLTRSISASVEISVKLGELQNCKSSLEKWKDGLCSEKTLEEQHLEAWRDGKQKSSEEKFELFEKLRHLWNEVDLTFLPMKELSSFADKVEELHKCTAVLKEIMREFQGAPEPKKSLNIGQRYPNNGKWEVNDKDELEAVACVLAGRKPGALFVATSRTAPIRQLPVVLDILGSACTGGIAVNQLDVLWEPSNKTDPKRLMKFIEKFGRKVSTFYGSPSEVVTLCRVNPTATIGVRLASMDDVDLCLNLPKNPYCVSCIKSLPAAAGERMRQLGWNPWKWHFPDVDAERLDWMISLMHPVLSMKRKYVSSYEIYLPRCRLTEENFRLLLNKLLGKSVSMHCELTDLSAPARERLEYLGAQINPKITFQWTISPAC